MIITNENKKKGYNLRWLTRNCKVLLLHNTVIATVCNQTVLELEIKSHERYLWLQEEVKNTPIKEDISTSQIAIAVFTVCLLVAVWIVGQYL